MSTETGNENWFQKAWNWITGEVKQLVTIEQHIATFVDKTVNFLKTDPTAVFIENGLVTIAETVNPALTPMIQGLELEIPKILHLVSNGELEAAKPIGQQAEDLLAYLSKLKNGSSSVYAGILATINAAIQYYVTSNNGIVSSPAQLLATGQVNHANNSVK